MAQTDDVSAKGSIAIIVPVLHMKKQSLGDFAQGYTGIDCKRENLKLALSHKITLSFIYLFIVLSPLYCYNLHIVKVVLLKCIV